MRHPFGSRPAVSRGSDSSRLERGPRQRTPSRLPRVADGDGCTPPGPEAAEEIPPKTFLLLRISLSADTNHSPQGKLLRRLRKKRVDFSLRSSSGTLTPLPEEKRQKRLQLFRPAAVVAARAETSILRRHRHAAESGKEMRQGNLPFLSIGSSPRALQRHRYFFQRIT